MNSFSELNNIFQEENSKILETITLLVYEIENDKKNDLFLLARLLDEQSLVNMISYFGGHTIKLPTSDEYYNSSVIAMMFYLVDIKGMLFPEAKAFLEKQDIKFQEHESIVGRKLAKSRQTLALKMAQIIEELKDGK